MKTLLCIFLIFLSPMTLASEILNYELAKSSIQKNSLGWINSLNDSYNHKLLNKKENFKFLVLLYSEQCEVKGLETLLDRGLNPNARDDQISLGSLVIMSTKSNDCLNRLVDAGLDLNITPNKSDMSLIETAVSFKNKKALKVLCNRGARLKEGTKSFKVTTIMAEKNGLLPFFLKNCSDGAG